MNRIPEVPARTEAGTSALASLLSQIVKRRRIDDGEGVSGAVLERATLHDGSSIILKHLDPMQDVIMRATHDRGRIVSLWRCGAFERMEPWVEHATIAVANEGDGWLLAMRDVGDSLFSTEHFLSRSESRKIIEAAVKVHWAFSGQDVPGLCSLEDLLGLLGPEIVRREAASKHPILPAVEKGWQVFRDTAPREVINAVFTILERPSLLANRLRQYPQTLLHGDLWVPNFGLAPNGRVVMIDWGLACLGPSAVDFGSYLAWSGASVDATPEELIDDYRQAWGAEHNEEALQLGLLAGIVQSGWSKALYSVENHDEKEPPLVRREFDWWMAQTRKSLEVWSPL